MKSLFSSVACLACGHVMPPDPMLAKCEVCGGAWLDARYDYEQVRWPTALAKRPSTLWRYADLLPLTDFSYKVSIGEGWTPIVRAERLGEALGHEYLFIKDERQSPTGSFKDRQGSLSVSVLRQAGIQEIVLASTGNAAAAYAAYCARAGIKLWVFLTSMVPNEKMRELGLYGAEVVKITGTYDQAKGIASDFAARRGLYFDRGAKGVPGKESMKTLAFEIAEQLGLEFADGERWIAPDWYIQAVSGGIGPLGVQKGFQELFQMGMIDKMPKLGIIQSQGCAPMVMAFEKGLEKADPVTPSTLITVLSTGDPGHSYTLLREAILRNGGAMVSVDDGQAFRAMRRVARTEGFSVEPATAVAFAGLEKLIALGTIRKDETVLINCSGHTFPAEKHILEDQYVLELQFGDTAPAQQVEGLGAALERLDEQITTVVVIDDNPNDSRLIRRLLQAHKNYRVFETNNPLDGLDLVRQRRPDLIISDLTMPQLDGFTLLEQLKQDPDTAHIPIIVLSGKSLTLTDKARLEGRIESVWLKGNYKTTELVDHVVSTLKDRPSTALANTKATNGEANIAVPPNSNLLNTNDMPNKAQQDIMESNQKELSNTESTELEGSKYQILVVDDNPFDSGLVRRILEASKKFKVTEARTGQSALTIIPELHPDLIILDMLLPDMGGLDVLQQIRASHDASIRAAKVAVLSAKDLTAHELSRLDQAVFWAKGTLDRRHMLEAIENQVIKTP